MKNLPNYLPILSVAFIFTGYCNLHFYYCTQFNIDIYQYISTGEIILSFLPIAYYLFIFILIFGFFTILIITSPDGEKKIKKEQRVFSLPFVKYKISTGKDYSFAVFNRFFIIKKKILSPKQKWFLRYKMFFHFETIVLMLWILLTIYGLKNDWMGDVVMMILFGTIWLILLFMWMQKRFNMAVGNHFKKSYKQVYLACILFIIFIFLDYAANKEKAVEVKNGKNKNAICFNYDNDKFDTFNDTTLSYIGSTQQYIFIHNLRNKNNFVFEKSKVSGLIIGDKSEKTLMQTDKKSSEKVIATFSDSLKKHDTLKVVK